jgi:hypothetical protein
MVNCMMYEANIHMDIGALKRMLSWGVCATVDGRKNSHTLSPLARVVMHLFQSEETRM